MKFLGKMNRDQFFAWLNPEGMSIPEQYNPERLLSEYAEVPKEVYDHFLNIMPPKHYAADSFSLCEAATQHIRLAFFRFSDCYYAAYIADDDPRRGLRATRGLIEAAETGNG